jgi:hypothetical protein
MHEQLTEDEKMGITVNEILEELANLVGSIDYWKKCQPHLVPEDLESSVKNLIEKLEAIKTSR